MLLSDTPLASVASLGSVASLASLASVAPVARPCATPALPLAEVIGALSYALDLTEGQPPGHSLRCCWIGMQLGLHIGLDSDLLCDLHYTLLLKDTGCSSNAARLWQLYGGDERGVKRDFKTVNAQSQFAVGRFVLQHAGPGEALSSRIGRVLNLARHAAELTTELIATRCERGADIVARIGFGTRVAEGIRSLDEHWNGGGHPRRISGKDIPLAARVALLAQVIDVFHILGGPDAARAEVVRRSGTWFDPALVAGFLELSQSSGFWQGLDEAGLAARVAALEPARRAVMVDAARLDLITSAFADVVDAKSPFTSGHSTRVSEYACGIARAMDFGPEALRRLRRVGLLHDVGKLGVSNGILDKPGKLTEAEWTVMRAHPGQSSEILGRVSVFSELAPVAGAHHERLDGKGYPNRLEAEQIPLAARILTTADVFDAITAERPYRSAIPVRECLDIMHRDSGIAFDPLCLAALEAHLAETAAVS